MKSTATFPGLAMIKECKIDNMRSGQTNKYNPKKKNGYFRAFLARYSYEYINEEGEREFINMQMNVIGYNDIARYIKEGFSDGDKVCVSGILISIDSESYGGVETAIEVLNVEDLVKLPKGWDNERC